MSDVIAGLLALPLIGAVVVAMLPQRETNLAKGVGLLFALGELAAAMPLLTGFEVGQAGYQFETNVAWIAEFGIHYHVGVDGFSLWIILLTALLTPLCIWGAWSSISHRGAEFVAAMLVLEAGLIGSLVALDLILFFTFWELMLVPMYLIIGVWGSEARVGAAVKFFLYTMFGSALMLGAIVYVAVQHYHATGGTWSFDLVALRQVVLTPAQQQWCFWAFVLSFAIKLPLFPLHTWLPDAHTQAPTPGSVMLAGVLLKLGSYGLVRFAFPLFPLAAGEGAQILAVLAVVGIVFAALVAWVQTDAKRLVAYSSISHMGLIVLGIVGWNTQGLTGATFQSLAHGLTTGALFVCIGVLYERRQTRLVSEFGGLAKVMPWFSACFLIAMLGAAGLPGLVGFVGDFLIFVGTFSYGGLTLHSVPVLVLVAASGVVLVAVYLLRLFGSLMFGKITHPKNEGLRDLSLREFGVLAPLLVLIVAMGMYPKPFIERIDPTAQAAVKDFQLRRCASILHAGGRYPVLIDTLRAGCEAPVEVIASVYGDERPDTRRAKFREAAAKADAAKRAAPAVKPAAATGRPPAPPPDAGSPSTVRVAPAKPGARTPVLKGAKPNAGEAKGNAQGNAQEAR